LGSTEVVVPFAVELAKGIDPTAVRMRRDFPSLLGLIQAHALLHQHTRDRAGTKVIAEVRDYAAVYDLTAEMIAEAAELVVPEIVRETVDAVFDMQRGLGGAKLRVTMAALAERLSISRSTASRRVKRAMRQGFIQDISPDKGGPRILETGEPMPSDTEVLPHPSALRRS
jgi:hypothetical protein